MTYEITWADQLTADKYVFTIDSLNLSQAICQTTNILINSYNVTPDKLNTFILTHKSIANA